MVLNDFITNSDCAALLVLLHIVFCQHFVGNLIVL